MAAGILRGVLPLAEWPAARRLDDLRAALQGALVMRVDVLHVHDHVLADFARTRQAKLRPLPADHRGAVADDELGVTDAAAGTGRPEALREAEHVAEEVERL